MTYLNCIGCIREAINKQHSPSEWKNRKILFLGADSLAKSIVHILKEYGSEMMIFDLNYRFFSYSSIPVVSDISGKINNFNCIIVTEKKYLESYSRLLSKTQADIIDFTFLRMNYFPKLTIPESAKKISLREAQIEMSNILFWFHDFCQMNRLRYSLDAGSLIGAIRHKGFIPWDDDIDVIMPMPDYQKAVLLLNNESKYSLISPSETEKSISSIAKIVSKNTFAIMNHYPIKYMCGIGIDIWAIAGFPSTEKEQIEYSAELEQMGEKWKEQIVIPYNETKDFMDKYKDFCTSIQKLVTKYDYDTSEFAGYAYIGKVLHIQNKENRAVRKEACEKLTLKDFEGGLVSCTELYDYYLSKLFGNYMELPPIEKRIAENTENIYRI